MSGIVGVFSFDRTLPADPEGIRRAHAAIETLGPDGGSTVSLAGCGLGQSLSRLDDPDGDPAPVWDAERRLVAVADARPGRPVELRKKLDDHGHRFRGRSVAELLLNAYRQWGVECVDHLEGAYAFAVFDKRAHTLFMARDRLGQCPLYVYRDGHRLCFGSRMGAILAQGVARVLDPQAVDDFLSFGFVPGGRTVVREVTSLPPGEALYAERRRFRRWTYWRPEFRPTARENLEQGAEALLSAVDRAVQVPGPKPGLALGDDLGGGFVAAAAARRWSSAAAYTGVSPGTIDEGTLASDVAGAVGLAHEVLTVPPPGIEDWTTLMTDGEPPPDASALARLRLARAVEPHRQTIWTGAGATYVFGSGPRYRSLLRAARVRSKLAQGTGWLPGTQLPSEIALARSITSRAHRRWYTQDFLHGLERYDGSETWRGPGVPGGAEGPLSRMQAADWRERVAHGLLADYARIDGHVAVRWRHPLLDPAVLELVSHLPERYRVDASHDLVVLRRAARRVLPPGLVERSGVPARIPLADWLRGSLREPVEAALFGRSTGLFSPRALRGAWYRLMLGAPAPAPALWRVAALESWAANVWPGGPEDRTKTR